MIDTGAHIALTILLLALIIAFIRLIKGPSLPDRVIALDLISSLAVGIVVVFAFISEKQLYIDIALIVSPIIFLGTVTVAKYLKTKARND